MANPIAVPDVVHDVDVEKSAGEFRRVLRLGGKKGLGVGGAGRSAGYVYHVVGCHVPRDGRGRDRGRFAVGPSTHLSSASRFRKAASMLPGPRGWERMTCRARRWRWFSRQKGLKPVFVALVS